MAQTMRGSQKNDNRITPQAIRFKIAKFNRTCAVQKKKGNKMHRFDLEKNNDLTKAARAVLRDNPQDQPWEAYRGDMLCLHGDSIQWLAERSIRNEPSLGYAKYVPFAGIE